MSPINWFWAHRRNTSLHHMSLFVRGLHGNGFLPEVNFSFYNQIYVGKPGKGVYIFYDQDEMKQKYKDIQESIKANKNIATDFRNKSVKIFEDLFTVCNKIKSNNLKELSKEDLLSLLKEFKEKITVGPLITVQLWGIEACWDDNHLLSQELKNKAPEDFDKLKGVLSQSTGKSVAFSERESFLQTLLKIKKSPEQKKELIENHVEEYEWINSEYVSKKLDLNKWEVLFDFELKKDTEKELEQLYSNYNKAIEEKNKLIEELNLSSAARHVLLALNEFVADRDWAKGKFCYALAVYDLMLDEISLRKEISKEDLLYMDVNEVISLFNNQNINPSNRKNGFALVSKYGKIEIIHSPKLNKFIDQEGIQAPFSQIDETDSFKGVIACKGKIQGKVRVIDDPNLISTFEEDEILVTYMTTMEFSPLFKKAKGIITDEGGLSSHAAIIAREFALPCIVGTKISTRTLKTGDLIELNADKGIINILDRNQL